MFNADGSSQISFAEAASLLCRIPVKERKDVLVMAMTALPPFARGEVRQLSRLLGRFGNGTDASSAIPILLQPPIRRTTGQLLQQAIDTPSTESLETLLKHLEKRCDSQRPQIINDTYRQTLKLLRHGTASHRFDVDPYGWVSIRTLLEAINKQALKLQLWRDWRPSDLLNQERLNGGERIRVDVERERVRVLYGHSCPDVCAGIRQPPPPELFHGASATDADLIVRNGLRPMSRTLVHLTSDLDYATAVASKHSSPMVLRIDSSAASNANVQFWKCNSHVWQCSSVPASFIGDITCRNEIH